MTTPGAWKPLLAILFLAGLSRAEAAPGDLLWSNDSAPGLATATAIARQGVVVVARGPSLSGLVIRIYDPVTGRLRREHAVADDVTASYHAVVRGRLVVVLVGNPAAEWPRSEHHLLAVHLGTGRVRWRRSLGVRPEFNDPYRPVSIAALGHRLYVSGEAGAAMALDVRNGRVLWRDGHEGVAAIAVQRGQVVVTGFGFPFPRLFVRMLDAESGRLRWEHEDDLGSSHGAFASTVAFSRNRVVVGGWVTRSGPHYDGDYYDDPLLLAYDADSGLRLWEKEAFLANDQRVHRILTREGRVFALIKVQTSWRMEAREVESGTTAWESGLLLLDSNAAGPVIAGDALYLASDPFADLVMRVVGGIAVRDGAIGWTTRAQTDATYSGARALAADDERLYVAGTTWDAERLARQAIWAHALR